ncbi:MAG: right-handed parallel beta-helix repeat-containing protein [Calditrichaceae bacterium]|nr:right-handed parallel beta-helix repeat-containing protein [Calditrichaceae bacterium]
MENIKYILFLKRNVFFLFLLLTGIINSLSAQTTIFVSPNGKDKNKGTEKAPVKSINKAQIMARDAKGKVIIYLREGKYTLEKTLIFTSKDGNENKHLTISSFPGEKVIISGGIELDLQWNNYKNGIFKSKINTQIPIDMLTVNGEIRHMARYPNYDSSAVRFNGTSADATSPERVKTWKNPAGGYLHAMHVSDWGDFHYRIKGKDENGNLDLEGGWQNNRPYGLSKENRMVENIFEELDAPGEWYYDISGSVLYYYPIPGEDINNAKFEAAQLKNLVDFRGTGQEPVKNITIKDIEFIQTERTFMDKYEPLLRSDWTIYRGGAIFFEGTENCELNGCYLHNLGGNAVFFSNYNRNSRISGCHVTNIGASAVCFVGDTGAVRSPSFNYHSFVPFQQIDREPGPKTNNYPANCTVYNNLIHTIGLFEKQITGVELSMSEAITVSHNSIYDIPRAGINVSEGTWGGHIIEFNDIFETVKETGDHGSFNSWGRDRFWHPDRDEMNKIAAKEPSLIIADAISTVIIRNNRFRCDRGWDIDLDDGSSNYHIYNNLCLNGGIKLREGFYRVVENNILVNNTFHPHVWFENSGDVFTRNIVMSSYQPINLLGWGTMIDYNVFTDDVALEEAQKNGTDEHSIVYPVEFQGPENGDYSVVNSATPVFRMGFLNFDMNCFGVVSPEFKRLLEKPRMTLPIIKTEDIESSIIVWQGWRIKNLEKLGERSATGMDSERGVYVISIIEYDSRLRDFLKPNDVILKFNGKIINNIKDLHNAAAQADLTKLLEMTVFRNQKAIVVTVPGDIIQPDQP